MACCLVLGIGNILLTDDGAGVRAAEALAQRLAAFCGVRVIDGGTLSFTLLDYLLEADDLIVLDAAELGAEPGEVRSFESAAMDAFLADTTRRRSVHDVGLNDLVGMARLGGRVPERRALICIQAGEVGWGLELTPAVKAAVPVAAGQAQRLLERWRS